MVDLLTLNQAETLIIEATGELRQRLKNNEIDYKDHLDGLRKHLTKEQARVSELEKKLDDLRSSIAQAKAERDNISRNRTVTSVEYVNLLELEEKYRTLEKQAQTAEEQLKVKDRKLAEYIETSEKLKRAFENEKKEYQEIFRK